jgi:hypothetical protein
MTPSKRCKESSKPLTHGRRMAKYKEYDYSQGKFIPINFDKQILRGTFEHTLHYLIDSDLDLPSLISAIRMTRPAPRPTIRTFS